MNPEDFFIDLIEKTVMREQQNNIWNDSHYRDIVKLQSNNVGTIGERLIQKICQENNISACIDGVKSKSRGRGQGDGRIRGHIVEIKTAHQGSVSSTFQHELGEQPWLAEYMIFVDVAPSCIYLTIFSNFTEECYKTGRKCAPCFPTKKITWRKKIGAFKLDTSISINEENIKTGNTIKIKGATTDFETLGIFINQRIPESTLK